jgi:hypothetical protein
LDALLAVLALDPVFGCLATSCEGDGGAGDVQALDVVNDK